MHVVATVDGILAGGAYPALALICSGTRKHSLGPEYLNDSAARRQGLTQNNKRPYYLRCAKGSLSILLRHVPPLSGAADRIPSGPGSSCEHVLSGRQQVPVSSTSSISHSRECCVFSVSG
jgi:hypothetical protein